MKTSEILAKEHGVSKNTVERAGAAAEAIDNNATPELINKVESGQKKRKFFAIESGFFRKKIVNNPTNHP